MDPITIVVAALAAGAAKSAEDVAEASLKDAYSTLKNLLKKIFAGRPSAQMVLEEHEADPLTYQAPLEKHLKETDAAQDKQVLQAAHELLELADSQGVGNRGYVVGTIVADRGGVAAAHIEGGVRSEYRAPKGENSNPF